MLIPEARGGHRIRKCFHPDADGMQALHRHYNSVWAPALSESDVISVNFPVYQRVVKELLCEENLDAIAPRGYDHTVCSFGA